MDLIIDYDNSPFRILGLGASATLPEIEETGRAMLELSIKVYGDGEEPNKDAYSCGEIVKRISRVDYPWMNFIIPTPAMIKGALEKLHDDNRRYLERLWGVYIRSEVDLKNWRLVQDGLCEEAVKSWHDVWVSTSNSIYDRGSAMHNLAVLFHSRALDKSRNKFDRASDLAEAKRWWNRTIETNFLFVIMSSGEDFALTPTNMGSLSSEFEDNPKFENKANNIRKIVGFLRRAIIQCVSQEQFILEQEGLGDWQEGVKLLNVEEKIINVTSKADIMKYRTELLHYLEKAEVFTVNYQYDKAQDYLRIASGLVIGNLEEKMFKTARDRLELQRIKRGLLPIDKIPELTSETGFMGLSLGRYRNYDESTRSFEARVRWVFAFLPVWYMGRYRLKMDENDDWQFLGRNVEDIFCGLYNVFCAAFVIVLLLLSVYIYTK